MSYDDRWGRLGISCTRVPYDKVSEVIHAPASPEAIFDAIVFRGDSLDPYTGKPVAVEEIVALSRGIRDLPENVAMFDGKKWRSIPIVMISRPNAIDDRHGFFDQNEDDLTGDIHEGELIDPHNGNNFGADVITERIVAYRQAVLSDFDNMGFMVRCDRGRYTVAPALKSREELDSKYYFGPADKRPAALVTVHRDNFGVQVEVEELEALINREDVSEHELQKFFESHPHFLSTNHTLLPQVRLPKADGGLLIPDFIMKPTAAQQRDSRWKVFDLKLPQVKLLSGKGSRAKLSSKVMGAIRQLRDYKEHFERPDHAGHIASLLGHALKRPQLGVLIGKYANTDTEALDREQRYHADVEIVTYDEILEQQQLLVDP
jgi:Domain of unknown function (DUF4263)